MNGRRLIFLSIVGVGALGLLAGSPADTPEQITIEKCGTKKSAVVFNHALHHAAEANCTTCHHTDEGLTDEAGTATRCRDCHFEPEADVPSCSEMSPSKNPYHKQCVSCHKTAIEVDESVNAPTKCDGCHPKE